VVRGALAGSMAEVVALAVAETRAPEVGFMVEVSGSEIGSWPVARFNRGWLWLSLIPCRTVARVWGSLITRNTWGFQCYIYRHNYTSPRVIVQYLRGSLTISVTVARHKRTCAVIFSVEMRQAGCDVFISTNKAHISANNYSVIS
jgi:hypothetical protein